MQNWRVSLILWTRYLDSLEIECLFVCQSVFWCWHCYHCCSSFYVYVYVCPWLCLCLSQSLCLSLIIVYVYVYLSVSSDQHLPLGWHLWRAQPIVHEMNGPMPTSRIGYSIIECRQAQCKTALIVVSTRAQSSDLCLSETCDVIHMIRPDITDITDIWYDSDDDSSPSYFWMEAGESLPWVSQRANLPARCGKIWTQVKWLVTRDSSLNPADWRRTMVPR